MNIKGMKSLALCVAVGMMLASGSVSSAQPGTIGYQGALRNSLGVAIDGVADLTFRLYDQPTGGAAIWTETHVDVQVDEGRFGVQLGSIESFFQDPPNNLEFDRPYYLSIEVDTDGEMAPRLPFDSAPFALSSRAALGEVRVDCTDGESSNHDSIQAALDAAPAGHDWFVVNIDGICTGQSVEVRRSNVLLRAVNMDNGGASVDPPVHGLTGSGAGEVIEVSGATNVFVRNLLVDCGGSADSGVLVTSNGTVTLDNTSHVLNCNRGISAHNGAVFFMFDSTIDDPSPYTTKYGIVMSDGASGRVKRSTVRVNVSVTPAFSEAAIGGFRGTRIRLEEDNTIINAGDDGAYDAGDVDAEANDDNGPALSFFFDGTIRAEGNPLTTTTIGLLEVGHHVHASFRNPVHVGDVEVGSHSIVEFRNNSGGADEVSAREIDVSGDSHLEFSRDAVNVDVSDLVQIDGGSALGIRGTIDFGELEVGDSGLHISPNATLTIANDFQVYNRSSINHWGAGSTISVGTDMGVGPFVHWNMGPDTTMVVNGQINMYNFNQMFAGNDVDFTGDLTFGAFTNVHMFGDNIVFTGDIFLPGQGDGNLAFGRDATFDGGTVRCNGTTINFTNYPTFINGATLDNCNIYQEEVDLSIDTLGDAPDPAVQGETVVYTHEVENLEVVGHADNVSVNVDVSGVVGDVTAVGGDIASGCYEPGGGPPISLPMALPAEFDCDLGGLGGGETSTLTVSVVSSDESGTITSVVEVSSSNTDPANGNDTDTETTTVQLPPP